jgi:hypothetical protein
MRALGVTEDGRRVIKISAVDARALLLLRLSEMAKKPKIKVNSEIK